MTICAWCDELLAATAKGVAAEAASHGLCRLCLDQALARASAGKTLRAPRVPVPAPALAPLAARA